MGTVLVSPVDFTLPAEPKDAVVFLSERVRDLNLLVTDIVNSLFYTTHAEPGKPRDGMIRKADGTNWDPGDGEGLYQRIAGSWVKFGPSSVPSLSYVDLVGAAAPANPPAGTRRVYLDSGSGVLSARDSAGAAVSIELGNVDEWDSP